MLAHVTATLTTSQLVTLQYLVSHGMQTLLVAASKLISINQTGQTNAHMMYAGTITKDCSTSFIVISLLTTKKHFQANDI